MKYNYQAVKEKYPMICCELFVRDGHVLKCPVHGAKCRDEYLIARQAIIDDQLKNNPPEQQSTEEWLEHYNN